MKVREIMSSNAVCCLPSDTAQTVARLMRERNVGSIPVVSDQQSKKLIGMVTDRDLCVGIVADGLDPKTTRVEKFLTAHPVSCREGENVENCERAMQERQVRRIPVVDAEDRVIGIVAQADLALKEKPDRVHKTVAEISRANRPSAAA